MREGEKMVGSTFSSVRVASFGYKNLVKRELIFSRKREEEACREATSSPEKLAEEGRVEASIRSRSAPNSLSHLAATTGARPWRWWMVKQWHPRRSTPLDPRRRAPPPPTHLPLTRPPLLRAGARRCFPGGGGGEEGGVPVSPRPAAPPVGVVALGCSADAQCSLRGGENWKGEREERKKW